MSAFSDSWALTKATFRTIREAKSLLLFPLVSGLALIGIILLVIAGLFTIAFYTQLPTSLVQGLVVALALIAYFLLWITYVFFQAALVGAAMLKLNGGQPKFRDGLAAARAKARKLVLWALIAGTVILIIRAVASRLHGLSRIIFGLAIAGAWRAMTYFVLPVLMFEAESTWRSLKRSGGLFARNFGRTFVSNLVLGLLLAAGFVLGFALMVVGGWTFTASSMPLGTVMAVGGIVFIVFMVILSSAAEGVLVTALYRYATTGQIAPGLIPTAYVRAVAPQGIAPDGRSRYAPAPPLS